MLEARVEIPDDIASPGFKRAKTPGALLQIASQYGYNLVVIWAVVAFVDLILRAGYLILPHLAVLTGLWIAATIYRYFAWSKEIAQTRGWTFYAQLDDHGVTLRRDPTEGETRVSWSFYKNYVEYETYLQIEDSTGNFSFLPKTPELFELIEFTKTKIPEK